DNTIIAHEKEVEKLKSEISDLRKQLRILQQDKKFKDEVRSIQDGRIIELENKVERLKARIRILINKKISINALDMATADLIGNINRGLDQIENHIRGAGTLLPNPINILDGIRGLLNTIWNILNETNEQEWVLIQQLRDMRNENLRFQQLLNESRAQAERTVREKDNA
ncbi:7399_t:CDS:2, partial [Rhizophagus irregularis]